MSELTRGFSYSRRNDDARYELRVPRARTSIVSGDSSVGPADHGARVSRRPEINIIFRNPRQNYVEIITYLRSDNMSSLGEKHSTRTLTAFSRRAYCGFCRYSRLSTLNNKFYKAARASFHCLSWY